MQSAALGENPPLWVKKYAVDNLRFVEFERKALPCALMRAKDGAKSLYTFSLADMDARSVMEQRLQSMVCCFSLVQQVISRNNLHRNADVSLPLVPYLPAAAVERVWAKIAVIPALLREHLFEPAKFAVATAQLSALQNISKHEAARVASSPNSAASSKENAPQAASRSTSDANAAFEVLTIDKAIEQKRAHLQLIEPVLKEVESLVEVTPTSLSKLRESCLSLRAALRKLEPVTSAKARFALSSCQWSVTGLKFPGFFSLWYRINQLVDILALWAFTSNFSTVQVTRWQSHFDFLLA
jgi:hypothetical protein